jgi:hypothetical protein
MSASLVFSDQGTGKEYIGDDVDEIAHAVKHALQSCCAQVCGPSRFSLSLSLTRTSILSCTVRDAADSSLYAVVVSCE